jgi:hypothetical protein
VAGGCDTFGHLKTSNSTADGDAAERGSIGRTLDLSELCEVAAEGAAREA